jgi:hypothetical protein
MNFQEYINQEDPKRLASGTVVLKREEYELLNMGTHKVIAIQIDGVHYDYRTNPPIYASNEEKLILYSMDSDGNPKAPSCFAVFNKDIV